MRARFAQDYPGVVGPKDSFKVASSQGNWNVAALREDPGRTLPGIEQLVCHMPQVAGHRLLASCDLRPVQVEVVFSLQSFSYRLDACSGSWELRPAHRPPEPLNLLIGRAARI